MSDRTVVHLVRHGEVHNPTKVLYGRLPGFRLSDRGVEQAERVAHFLVGRDVAAVIASPLERARQTAAPIAAAHGLDVGIDPRMIESSNVFEGGVVEPGPGVLRHPRVWRHLNNPFRPSWGSRTPTWRNACCWRSQMLAKRRPVAKSCWSAISCRSG